jgi:hypothetical protein
VVPNSDLVPIIRDLFASGCGLSMFGDGADPPLHQRARVLHSDNVSLVGPAPGIAGLYICAAMNSGGVTYSAAAGHMIADLISETAPRFDAAAFVPERFGDKAKDLAWLKGEISSVVSRGYRQTNL